MVAFILIKERRKTKQSCSITYFPKSKQKKQCSPALIRSWRSAFGDGERRSSSHQVVARVMWEATRLTQGAGCAHAAHSQKPQHHKLSLKWITSHNQYELSRRSSHLHWYPPPAVCPLQLLQAGAELGAPGSVEEETSETWASAPRGLWIQHWPENSLQIFSTASRTTWSLNWSQNVFIYLFMFYRADMRTDSGQFSYSRRIRRGSNAFWRRDHSNHIQRHA